MIWRMQWTWMIQRKTVVVSHHPSLHTPSICREPSLPGEKGAPLTHPSKEPQTRRYKQVHIPPSNAPYNRTRHELQPYKHHIRGDPPRPPPVRDALIGGPDGAKARETEGDAPYHGRDGEFVRAGGVVDEAGRYERSWHGDGGVSAALATRRRVRIPMRRRDYVGVAMNWGFRR